MRLKLGRPVAEILFVIPPKKKEKEEEYISITLSVFLFVCVFFIYFLWIVSELLDHLEPNFV